MPRGVNSRNNGGYVLITVMFILVALTVIGMAGVFISTLDTGIAGNERVRSQCWDLSDLGTREAVARIITNTMPTSPLSLSFNIGGQTGTFYSGHYDGPMPIIQSSPIPSTESYYGMMNMTWKTAYMGFGYRFYIVPIAARLGNTPCQEIEVGIRLFQ